MSVGETIELYNEIPGDMIDSFFEYINDSDANFKLWKEAIEIKFTTKIKSRSRITSILRFAQSTGETEKYDRNNILTNYANFINTEILADKTTDKIYSMISTDLEFSHQRSEIQRIAEWEQAWEHLDFSFNQFDAMYNQMQIDLKKWQNIELYLSWHGGYFGETPILGAGQYGGETISKTEYQQLFDLQKNYPNQLTLIINGCLSWYKFLWWTDEFTWTTYLDSGRHSATFGIDKISLQASTPQVKLEQREYDNNISPKLQQLFQKDFKWFYIFKYISYFNETWEIEFLHKDIWQFETALQNFRNQEKEKTFNLFVSGTKLELNEINCNELTKLFSEKPKTYLPGDLNADNKVSFKENRLFCMNYYYQSDLAKTFRKDDGSIVRR